MNYLIFSAYSTTVVFAAGFVCGYIWQTLIQEAINGTINS